MIVETKLGLDFIVKALNKWIIKPMLLILTIITYLSTAFYLGLHFPQVFTPVFLKLVVGFTLFNFFLIVSFYISYSVSKEKLEEKFQNKYQDKYQDEIFSLKKELLESNNSYNNLLHKYNELRDKYDRSKSINHTLALKNPSIPLSLRAVIVQGIDDKIDS